MPAKIERSSCVSVKVGKTYTTRSGHKAKILQDVGELGQGYPFYGQILDSNGKHMRIAYYTSTGRYSTSHQSQFDLIV